MEFQKRTNYFTLALDRHSKMTTELTRQTKSTGHNRRLAQWRVTWLIEHSTSHQLLWCIDSFVLRNPPLRQAPKRYASPCDSPLIGGQLKFGATVFQICFNSSASLPTHILAHLQASQSWTHTKPAKELKSCRRYNEILSFILLLNVLTLLKSKIEKSTKCSPNLYGVIWRPYL